MLSRPSQSIHSFLGLTLPNAGENCYETVQSKLVFLGVGPTGILNVKLHRIRLLECIWLNINWFSHCNWLKLLCEEIGEIK